MKQVLIVLALLLVIVVVPRLFQGGDDAPRPAAAPTSSQVYAADGAFIGAAPPRVQPRNLIVLLLDTVRRDVVGLGDEPVRQMPRLRALSERGVAFRQAASMAPWTIPTIASVLTGLLPTEHGCRTDGPAPKLLGSVTTYAEVLRTSYGFETAAFSDVPFYRGEPWSILQGFESGSAGQGMMLRPRRPLASGFWLHGCAGILAPWVAARDRAKPFFLFLHTYDAHDPYGAANHPPAVLPMIQDPEEYRRRVTEVGDTRKLDDAGVLELVLTSQAGRRALIEQNGAAVVHRGTRYAWQGYREKPRPLFAQSLHDRYLAGVRWADDGLGELLAYLETSGLLENTLFVIFADHGEAFGEHGLIGHGRQLEEELLHVPLVLVGPGPFAKPAVIDASVGTMDILPTFMDWIGARDLAQTRGRSLLPVIRGESAGHPVTSQARVVPEMTATDDKQLLESVRGARWKYILRYDLAHGRIDERLFDLSQDPGERTNRLTEGKTLAAFELSPAFCEAVEAARDRIFEAAASIRERGFTAYSAGVPTTDQPRPAACGAHAKGR